MKKTFFDKPSDRTRQYQSTDQILYIDEKSYTCDQLISFDQNLYSSEQQNNRAVEQQNAKKII